MGCILLDPYANAFNENANGHCFAHDKTDMKPEICERKYEIDSLCFPMQLSYLLWKNTGRTLQFNERWQMAAETVLFVFETEQYHESRSPYRFQRENCPYTDTLSRDGKGALVKEGTGLIFSGFRPRDDACRYGYLIPSNMLAAVTLSEMAKIAGMLTETPNLHRIQECAKALESAVRRGIEQYAIVYDQYTDGSPYYAYEVDGFGQLSCWMMQILRVCCLCPTSAGAVHRIRSTSKPGRLFCRSRIRITFPAALPPESAARTPVSVISGRCHLQCRPSRRMTKTCGRTCWKPFLKQTVVRSACTSPLTSTRRNTLHGPGFLGRIRCFVSFCWIVPGKR